MAIVYMTNRNFIILASLMMLLIAVPAMASTSFLTMTKSDIAQTTINTNYNIAFIYNNNIWVADTDTDADAVQLTVDGGDFVNGSPFDYANRYKDNNTVCSKHYEWPSWSPDGTKVAYALKENCWYNDYKSTGINHTGSIGFVIVVGMVNHKIANLEHFANESIDPKRFSGRPSWYPNSEEFIFLVRGYVPGLIFGDDYFTADRIYKIKTDGTGEEVIYSSKQSLIYYLIHGIFFRDLSYTESAALSPDASKIVFDKRLSGPESDLWIMNSDGTDQIKLDDAHGKNADYFCDGSWLAYEADYMVDTGGEAKEWGEVLFRINADGTDNKRIEVAPAGYLNTSFDYFRVLNPSISADGQHIAFSNGAEIWIADSSGLGYPERLTETEGGYPKWCQYPDWKKNC